MKKICRAPRPLRTTLLLSAVIGAYALPSGELMGVNWQGNAAMAQQEGPKVDLAGCQEEPEKRKLRALPQKFFKKVEDIDELMSPAPDEKTGEAPEPNYKDAWPKLQKLLDRCEDCNDYEWAQLYQRAAIIQFNLGNMSDAVKYFKQVVEKSPEIPLSLETQLTYQVAQLLTAEEKYRESLDWFGKWEALCPDRVPDGYFYFRAQNLYQLGDKDAALREVNRGIDNIRARDELPGKKWFDMQFALYYEKEDYQNAERAGEQLAIHYTSAKTVRQLATVYGLTEQMDKQVALLDALMQADSLDREGQYRNLAFSYLEREVPYLASEVLEEGFEKEIIERSSRNLNAYSAALNQALELEEATPIMEEAAEKADDGQLYSSLAAVYVNTENYDKAVEAARNALDKGIENPGQTYIFMATAYTYMEQFEDALDALDEASKDEDSKKYARSLKKYVKNERKRHEELKKAQANL